MLDYHTFDGGADSYGASFRAAGDSSPRRICQKLTAIDVQLSAASNTALSQSLTQSRTRHHVAFFFFSNPGSSLPKILLQSGAGESRCNSIHNPPSVKFHFRTVARTGRQSWKTMNLLSKAPLHRLSLLKTVAPAPRSPQVHSPMIFSGRWGSFQATSILWNLT